MKENIWQTKLNLMAGQFFGGPDLHNVTFVGESVTQAEDQYCLSLYVLYVWKQCVCVCVCMFQMSPCRSVLARDQVWCIRMFSPGCRAPIPSCSCLEPSPLPTLQGTVRFLFEKNTDYNKLSKISPTGFRKNIPCEENTPKNIPYLFLMQLQTIFWSYKLVSLGSFKKCKLWWRTHRHRPPIM